MNTVSFGTWIRQSSRVDRQEREGFTLIELLIALGLAGLLMGGLFITFTGALASKAVEAAAEQFAAALRAAQSQAIATQAPHIVYFGRNEYLVARYVKAEWVAGQKREVPIALETIWNQALFTKSAYSPASYGYPDVQWVVEKRSFKRAKIIAARFNNNEVVGDLTDLQQMNYVPMDYADMFNQWVFPRFMISPEGQIVGQAVNLASGDVWEVEGVQQPSYVVFASSRDLAKRMTVKISQGQVTVKPGADLNFTGVAISTMGEKFQ